jgi:hypothetical membrane protein
MKSRLQKMSGSTLAYSFAGVLVAGVATSALLTKDTRWMNWHFSRLGEGGTFPSTIFNIALLISAIIILALGITLKDNISNISDVINFDKKRVQTIVYRLFIATSICLIGVASFPFDRFPVIHNIFGYSMLTIFLILCPVIPRILPIFSQRFHKYSIAIICTVAVCYILFAAKIVTLLTVELIIYIVFYLWLLLFIKGIDKSCN